MQMKSQKISSVAAHASKTSCLRIGPKSGRVMVTGGQDKLVNLWAIGKQESVKSLSGHVTAIQSVSMDWSELLVVAGSVGGSLKLWDLDNAIVVRTLAGHRSSVTSVEFHPFGEFFASGSADLTLKVWDVRRKGCIQTYHGHTGPITELQISPDGRWVASGSEDGTVKLWDLTAGKLLTTFNPTGGAVQSVAFNPCEFVLCCSTRNGPLTVYDLNDFESISNYDSLSDKIVFTPEGENILVASKGSLKNITWEPAELVNELKTDWKTKIEDLKVLPDGDKYIACAINGNFVDIWAIGDKHYSHSRAQSAESIKFNPPASVQIDEDYFKGSSYTPRKPNSKPEVLMKPENSFENRLRAESILKNSDRVNLIEENEEFIKSNPVEFKKTGDFKYVPMADGQKPLNIDLATFIKQLPGQKRTPMLLTSLDPTSNSTPEEVMDDLLYRHTSVQTILNSKLEKVKLLRENWTEESIKPAIELLNTFHDSSVLIDMLSILNLRPKLYSLEIAVILVPLISELFFEIYEDFIAIGCKSLCLISKYFKELVKTTLSMGESQSGFNLTFEDRLVKCQRLKDEFVNVYNILGELKPSKQVAQYIKETFRELGDYLEI